MRFFFTVPSMPSMNTSSRTTCGLYVVKLRSVTPSNLLIGMRTFAFIGK